MKEKGKEKTPYTSWKGVGYALTELWRFDRRLFLLCLLRIPVLVLLPFSTVYLSKLVVQLVTEGAQVPRMLASAGLLVLGMVLLNVFSNYAALVSKGRAELFETKFYYKVFDKVMDTDYENVESFEGQAKRERAFSQNYSGEGVGLSNIPESLVVIASCVFGFVLYGVILAALNPFITLLLIAITAVNYFALTHVRKYEAAYLERRSVYERRLGYIQYHGLDAQNGKDIRLYRMLPWFRQLFKEALAARDREVWLFVARQILANVLNHCLVFIRDGLAYAYLIYLVLSGQMQVDDFILYFGLISGFSTWIVSLIDNFNWLARSGLIASNIHEYLEMPDYLNRGPGADLPQGRDLPCALEFKDVCFRYPGTEQPVFEHLQLTVKPGEKLAIVGVNGAGKTTLVKLLCGLYRPTHGEVLVNGKKTEEYNRDEYYTLFSTAFQDVHLLPMSIAKNVAMCPEEQIDRERVWDCLRKAGLAERVRGWKDGLDTNLVKGVQDDAADLSGGEQQKLIFARALYRDAPVLVLDEPTAALDPIAENQLYLQYSELAQDKTSIFISHRLSSTRFCDRIVFIENGKITEMGTHDELMAHGGGYAKMFEIQSYYYKKKGQRAPLAEEGA
ncbi:ABC transporter ATP-binding protein [Hydrogeniiclostridium mannosilyticum]|uniref:ABC transporter ATP-binding protein n=1 Tax=Hydrogeniiclostridium mannosilyticum TaxID=2764322 RepID=UPI0018A94D20|nr:ABC transporter ATP-binding protein [Hydrogeniiclostridium mannosilyticum]